MRVRTHMHERKSARSQFGNGLVILRAVLAGGHELDRTAERLGMTPTRLAQTALQLAADPAAERQA